MSDDEIATAKAQAREARSQTKAASKMARKTALRARREAREAARRGDAADEQATTEPVVDDHGAERPIAVAAQLQRAEEAAEQHKLEERETKEQQAAESRQAAQEARRAAKAEATETKAKSDAVREQHRQKADFSKQKQREEAAAAKVEAKRERDEAKAAAKQKSLRTKSPSRTDDHIVEPPREPKKSLLERLQPATVEGSHDGEDAPSSFLPTLAIVLGVLGFVFSVILAIGAFMVALNPQSDGGLFGLVSNVCDALVGPLRGLFSFSGTNGESKEALVAWGLGALGYLILGLFAQSFLRARGEGD